MATRPHSVEKSKSSPLKTNIIRKDFRTAPNINYVYILRLTLLTRSTFLEDGTSQIEASTIARIETHHMTSRIGIKFPTLYAWGPNSPTPGWLKWSNAQGMPGGEGGVDVGASI